MSNLSDIEASLNIVTYLRKYNEFYRGVDFQIIQENDQDWRAAFTTKVLTQKLDTYKEAFTYAMGYIDGCFEHLSEWSEENE
jgi:hypothetical protein